MLVQIMPMIPSVLQLILTIILDIRGVFRGKRKPGDDSFYHEECCLWQCEVIPSQGLGTPCAGEHLLATCCFLEVLQPSFYNYQPQWLSSDRIWVLCLTAPHPLSFSSLFLSVSTQNHINILFKTCLLLFLQPSSFCFITSETKKKKKNLSTPVQAANICQGLLHVLGTEEFR